MQGIVSYGAYIPRFKIETGEIASVWGADGSAWANNLNVYSKSVPGPDEDVITISVEAARKAMERVNVDGENIGAVYTGSESHPYAASICFHVRIWKCMILMERKWNCCRVPSM